MLRAIRAADFRRKGGQDRQGRRAALKADHAAAASKDRRPRSRAADIVTARRLREDQAADFRRKGGKTDGPP